MTTVCASDLHQVMAGLDLLEHPAEGSVEQRSLAERLFQQAQDLGLTLHPREAHLAARVLLNTPMTDMTGAAGPLRVPASPVASPLHPAVLRSFRKPPIPGLLCGASNRSDPLSHKAILNLDLKSLIPNLHSPGLVRVDGEVRPRKVAQV